MNSSVGTRGITIFLGFDANMRMGVVSDRYCAERCVPSGVDNASQIERAEVLSRQMGLVQVCL